MTSRRKEDLLEAAYSYVLEHGLAEVSLRPLAAAVGSSPRVLLYLFGSKDDLVRALLARARTEELRLLDELDVDAGLEEAGLAVWSWLADPGHRPLLVLWAEAYARSLVEPDGPWAGFAADTVRDWLAALGRHQAPAVRRSRAGAEERTRVLAVLRGALLDVLATGDTRRVSRAVERALH